MTMKELYNRVADWNAARYNQEFDADLLLNLLQEEWQEFVDAKDDVERLDALADMQYVALGGLWKLNEPYDRDCSVNQKVCDFLYQETRGLVIPIIFKLIDKIEFYRHANLDFDYSWLCYCTIVMCAIEMQGLGLTSDQSLEALAIVCDSNNSKVVHKVEAGVKANAGNKGDSYVGPEARLKALLEGI